MLTIDGAVRSCQWAKLDYGDRGDVIVREFTPSIPHIISSIHAQFWTGGELTNWPNCNMVCRVDIVLWNSKLKGISIDH